jgi:hypothetical protein
VAHECARRARLFAQEMASESIKMAGARFPRRGRFELHT